MIGLGDAGYEESDTNGTWNWARGSGCVPPTKGQYDRALRLGVDVRALLFSTFGGFSPEVEQFLSTSGSSPT